MMTPSMLVHLLLLMIVLDTIHSYTVLTHSSKLDPTQQPRFLSSLALGNYNLRLSFKAKKQSDTRLLVFGGLFGGGSSKQAKLPKNSNDRYELNFR
jgi:hypothetical protein